MIWNAQSGSSDAHRKDQVKEPADVALALPKSCLPASSVLRAES